MRHERPGLEGVREERANYGRVGFLEEVGIGPRGVDLAGDGEIMK